MERIEVMPAYGRTYATADEVKEHWNADKDFLMRESGSYINKSDVQSYCDNGAQIVVYDHRGAKVIATIRQNPE